MWIPYGTSTGRRTRPTAAPAGAPTVYAEAPVEMVRAGTKFLESWLVKRDVDEALGYISARVHRLRETEPSADQPPPKTAEDARAQLKKAMRKSSRDHRNR